MLLIPDSYTLLKRKCETGALLMRESRTGISIESRGEVNRTEFLKRAEWVELIPYCMLLNSIHYKTMTLISELFLLIFLYLHTQLETEIQLNWGC